MNLKINIWLSAFRLRTLPLSISSILMGSFLAFFKYQLNKEIFLGCIFTTIFLQILSNLANDYGDWKKGTDNEKRVGPPRAMQIGALSATEMKTAIFLFSFLSFISGIYLVFAGTKGLEFGYSLFFILLGLLAIAAAIKYTIGKNPYGYNGLGDLFVFIFFGLVAVLGTFFLQTHHIGFSEILPATSMGCLAVGVINLNNMRDIVNDKASGKITLAVKFGMSDAKNYQKTLIVAAVLCSVLYTIINYQWIHQFTFLIVTPLLYQHLRRVEQNTQPEKLDKELKKLALITLLFALTFGIGLLSI